jgi:hypothetical protein
MHVINIEIALEWKTILRFLLCNNTVFNLRTANTVGKYVGSKCETKAKFFSLHMNSA